MPSAPCDVVVTSRPHPRSAMAGSAARASQNFCERNSEMNRWYASSSARNDPSMIAPAQPTTMSSCPKCPIASRTAFSHPADSATES